MDQIDNFHIFLHRSLWAEILMPCFLSVFKDWEPNHLWSVLFFPLNRRQQLSGISMCVFPMSILIIYHFIILLFRYIWFLLIMSSSYCLEIFGFYLLISPHIILTITYHIYIYNHVHAISVPGFNALFVFFAQHESKSSNT